MIRPGNRLDHKFGDPKNYKFPIHDAQHARESWQEINTPEARKRYSAADHREVKSAIERAYFKHTGEPAPTGKRLANLGAPDNRPAHVAADFAPGRETEDVNRRPPKTRGESALLPDSVECDDETAAASAETYVDAPVHAPRAAGSRR
ncbi:MAG: DUF6582 domain-containing protein [Candidatus Binatus sp.]|jgi:hypothetical protein